RPDRAARNLQDTGHCFIAIDPARFRPLADFKRDMDDSFDSLKATPTAEGHDRVYVAGEPEAECEARRRREGIPLSPGLIARVGELARTLGLTPLVYRERVSSAGLAGAIRDQDLGRPPEGGVGGGGGGLTPTS